MNFDMSVFQFVSSSLCMQKSEDCWKIILMKFHKYLKVLPKCDPLLQFWLKSHNNNIVFTRRPTSAFTHISSVIRWLFIEQNVFEKRETWIWCPKVLLFERLSIFHYFNEMGAQKILLSATALLLLFQIMISASCLVIVNYARLGRNDCSYAMYIFLLHHREISRTGLKWLFLRLLDALSLSLLPSFI
jgi:hypothetical protein